MSYPETSDDKESIFIKAACDGKLTDVIEQACKFKNEVAVLSKAMISSCRWGHMDVVKWLTVHTAADVNYKGMWTVLTAACLNDHLELVKYLVESCQADVNLAENGGDTPLTTTCCYVCMSVSLYFLCEVNELDVNVADKRGNTALHYVIWCTKNDTTELHKACENRFGDVSEVLRLIYIRGHIINAQDNNGNTPLHLACFNGRNHIVKALMLAGAAEKITNDDRETPAQVAESRGHSELLKLLHRSSLQQEIMQR